MPSGVRAIYSLEGRKVSDLDIFIRAHNSLSFSKLEYVRSIILFGPQIGKLDDLEDGQSYVCSGFGEPFKRLDYEASAVTPQSFRLSGPESLSDSSSPSPARANNRLSRYLQVMSILHYD